MDTVFFNSEGLLLVHIMPRASVINTDAYVAILNNIKYSIYIYLFLKLHKLYSRKESYTCMRTITRQPWFRSFEHYEARAWSIESRFPRC